MHTRKTKSRCKIPSTQLLPRNDPSVKLSDHDLDDLSDNDARKMSPRRSREFNEDKVVEAKQTLGNAKEQAEKSSSTLRETIDKIWRNLEQCEDNNKRIREQLGNSEKGC